MKLKINAKKAAVCIACALCLLLSVTAVFVTSAPVSGAGGAEFFDDYFEDTYAYGSRLSMPQGVVLTYDGNEYTATKGYIRYPDGKVYSGTSFTLDMYGSYTVIYEAAVSGKTVSASHTFAVPAASYSVGSDSSYAMGKLNKYFGSDVTGLQLTLAAGETFTYNAPFNVYEKSETEIISFNCMHFEPIARKLTVRLTDCYDPSVYLDIVYSKVAYSETYILAGANGGGTCGVWNRASGTRTTVIDGTVYKLNDNGTAIPGNRKKENHAGMTEDRYNNITLSLNTENRKNIRIYTDTAPEGPVNRVVSELNNSDLYNYTFDGFTTGEVYLSITANTLVGANSVPVEIASLAGVKGDALAPIMLSDNVPPEIELSTDGDEINIMAGVSLTLPSAVAHDVNGIVGEVDCAVFYGYGTDFQRNVSVQDGKFLPDVFGTYTAVYTVADTYGNVGKKTLVMHAVRSGEEGIEFSCDKITDAAAGQVVSADGYTAVSLNGKATVEVSVAYPNGRVVTLSSPSEKFLLDRAGRYTVKYSYYDDLYSGSYSYDFTAEDRGIYRFESDAIGLPKYLIKGAEYSVDVNKAHLYTAQDPKEAEVNAYIKYDGGEFTRFDPASFTVTGNTSAVIRFTCANNENTYIESETVKITDVGYKSQNFDLAAYFAGDYVGSVSENDPDYVSYALTARSAGTLDFVNPLLLSKFGFRFSVSENMRNGAFTIVLTDYYDHANEARIRFSASGVSLDGMERPVSGSWIGAPFTVAYSSGSISLGGSIFEYPLSFVTDKILFSIEFEENSSAGKFNVYSVCNQTFGYYVSSDSIRPLLTVENPDRVASVGDVITLAKPDVADVLSPSPNSNCKVSVYKDGVTLRSESGTELRDASAYGDHSFKISDFGTYLIVYRYTDGAGRSDDIRWTIRVNDNIAPRIEFTNYGGEAVSVSLNTPISPIAYTVSDNITPSDELDVFIAVYGEKGIRAASTRDTFTLKKAGVYTVYVYCSDAAGNTAYATYLVNAK